MLFPPCAVRYEHEDDTQEESRGILAARGDSMNKEDTWQVIKAILKVLVGLGIILFLFMDSTGNIHGGQAADVLVGFVAGWLVTYLYYGKKERRVGP